VDINSQPDPEERLHRFYALGSAALGVFSLCAAVIPALGCMAGGLGIFLGILGRKSDRRTMAGFGISLSVIGVLTALIYSFLVYYAKYSNLAGSFL
jgi:hypothetical protein